MQVSVTALSAALVGLVVAGCDDGETAAPDWFEAREPMPSCGIFEPADVRNDNPDLAEGQECLLDAFKSGEPAELEVTQLTEEGDPVTDIFRVVDEGEVEALMDRRQDEFSMMDFGHLTCTELHEQEIPLAAAGCEATDDRRSPPISVE